MTGCFKHKLRTEDPKITIVSLDFLPGPTLRLGASEKVRYEWVQHTQCHALTEALTPLKCISIYVYSEYRQLYIGNCV